MQSTFCQGYIYKVYLIILYIYTCVFMRNLIPFYTYIYSPSPSASRAIKFIYCWINKFLDCHSVEFCRGWCSWDCILLQECSNCILDRCSGRMHQEIAAWSEGAMVPANFWFSWFRHLLVFSIQPVQESCWLLVFSIQPVQESCWLLCFAGLGILLAVCVQPVQESCWLFVFSWFRNLADC